MQIHRGNNENMATRTHAVGVSPAAVVDSRYIDFGDDNIVFRRYVAKEAIEKESLALTLSDLHPSVEVLGCMVTYGADEIVQLP